jgi:hypothetical protein
VENVADTKLAALGGLFVKYRRFPKVLKSVTCRAWFIYGGRRGNPTWRRKESADNIGYYRFRGGLQEAETVG